MDLSPIGRAAMKAREGDRLATHKDSVGIWTIGVGVTTASGLIVVKSELTISQAESDRLFAVAVQKYVDPARKALAKPVSQEFFDACCSFYYNIGPPGFAHSSVVRRANAGDMKGAIEAFLIWNKPSEIIPRRQGERDQAATPYSKALPKACAGDKSPAKVPKGAASVLAPPPDPLAPMTSVVIPLRSLPSPAVQDAQRDRRSPAGSRRWPGGRPCGRPSRGGAG